MEGTFNTPPPFPPYSGGSYQGCPAIGPGTFHCAAAPQGGGFAALFVVFLLFWLAGIVLALFASQDMDRRGQSGCLWGALVFFGGWIGIIFWLIRRKQYPVQGE